MQELSLLRKQIKEVNKTVDDLSNQLREKDTFSQELKAELVAIRKNGNQSSQFNNSRNDISSQSFYHDECDHGCSPPVTNQTNRSINSKVKQNNLESYRNVTSHIRSPQHQKLTREQPADRRLNGTSEEADFKNNWAQRSYRRPAPRHVKRYQSFFPGYCYSCYKFGHKEVACRSKPVRMFS